MTGGGSLRSRLEQARERVTSTLLSHFDPQRRCWTGELSASALSTATAITALSTVDRQMHSKPIDSGLDWLSQNQNQDGGWGDTIRSGSNLSTTALVWAAFGAAGREAPQTMQRAEAYLTGASGSLEQLPKTIETRYGKDRTFSIPILMMLALSGRLGPEGWSRVRPLPFELAALPRSFWGALRLPVVSYALPALIAIGQVIHHHHRSRNPIRTLTRRKTLEILGRLQPANGGFLEATPLTSFVTMSLAGMGLVHHDVTRRGVDFLLKSVRSDGSWPIDTNLATWVSTLSIKALRHQPDLLNEPQRDALREWLLCQQYKTIHPYTGAPPGAWAWTDLPGGVPDADDTAGALLALWELRSRDRTSNARFLEAIADGITWLLNLQNRDGGIPTFCRGWGALPFDRSTPELTAHALRAWHIWMPYLSEPLQKRAAKACDKAMAYLKFSQRPDGAWIPLWFGNEAAPQQENPVYGTALVLQALSTNSNEEAMTVRGIRYLASIQNKDGGWGGALNVPSSIEETSLALEALALNEESQVTVDRGAEWLVNAIEKDRMKSPAPIGLYFAKLWYFESLYPCLFAAGALGALCRK